MHSEITICLIFEFNTFILNLIDMPGFMPSWQWLPVVCSYLLPITYFMLYFVLYSLGH